MPDERRAVKRRLKKYSTFATYSHNLPRICGISGCQIPQSYQAEPERAAELSAWAGAGAFPSPSVEKAALAITAPSFVMEACATLWHEFARGRADSSANVEIDGARARNGAAIRGVTWTSGGPGSIARGE